MALQLPKTVGTLGRQQEDPMPHELPIPSATLSDPRARELLRVWAANGSQHVSMASGLWTDPAAWGIMLVDLAKHAARAYEQAGTHVSEEALLRIRAGFDAEWLQATSKVTGRLKDEDAG
jgi:hypothetical protein